jgi:AraC family transcriptional regulator
VRASIERQHGCDGGATTSAASFGNVCYTEAGRRIRLLESSIAMVEDLHGFGLSGRTSKASFSADFQVCLPYRGLFVWHVGEDDVVGDPNQVLFVTARESFHLSQPRSSDYAEIIITPNREVLEELAKCSGASLTSHPLFLRRSKRTGFELQQLRARFLQSARSAESETAVEEGVLNLLRAALDGDARPRPSAATRRLIRETKEFLEAHLDGAIRLADVARAVGASPAYLTDAFRRIEGVPLHRYLTQLRLARALVELPHANDLTMLALGLGFSSHSHFTAAFRSAFRCTPSEFREPARARARVRTHTRFPGASLRVSR